MYSLCHSDCRYAALAVHCNDARLYAASSALVVRIERCTLDKRAAVSPRDSRPALEVAFGRLLGNGTRVGKKRNAARKAYSKPINMRPDCCIEILVLLFWLCGSCGAELCSCACKMPKLLYRVTLIW